MNQKFLVAGSAALLLIAFVVGVFIFNQKKDDQAKQMAAANRNALIRMHSPSLGRVDAPVVIVEFLDPACETCRDFYPLVKQMMAANPDKIRLVLRYAPFHKGSDKVVAMLEAARRQGKFWPALEALLANQANWTEHHAANVERAWQHLGGINLNLEQAAYDLTSPEIAAVIAQDIADAKTLNVSKTPDFFVNGKPLPSFGFAQLKGLVDQALNENRSH